MRDMLENSEARLSTLGDRFMLAAEYPPTHSMVVTMGAVVGSLGAKYP